MQNSQTYDWLNVRDQNPEGIKNSCKVSGQSYSVNGDGNKDYRRHGLEGQNYQSQKNEIKLQAKYFMWDSMFTKKQKT